jgi:4-hydroxy-tetrahydrodipicolinate synthase
MEFEDGVYTVLMTPFINGVIDYESYERLIDHQLNSNITGVVVLGTTSESPTLGENEKFQLVEYVYNKLVNTNKKIIVGIGGNNTIDTLNFGLLIKDLCDYMMFTVPNYNKPNQDGIYEHFKYICTNDGLLNKAFILYNIPSRTCVNMLPDTVMRLFNDFNNIKAIKEASGDINQIMEIKNKCNIKIFSGDDMMSVPVTSIGGSGTISVLGNILPNETMMLFELCKNNDYNNAILLHSVLHKLIKSLFMDTNPVPGKELLHYINIFSSSEVRLPLVCLSDNNKNIISNIYNECISYNILNNNYINN